jgi:asparagine synthase (glutamine-hydrolysing)
MCGIAGYLSLGSQPLPPAEVLERMCETLVHRGPDDLGSELKDGVGLGMRRLAIIDLSGGRQPIYNEDHSVRVTFNGEIYNFRELRKQLEGAGHTFRTASDTEVLVHAYEEFGDNFAERLNGMFAIALHDLRRRRVILARDHIGIKPLFYASNGGRLWWGSEIKAILAGQGVPRELDFDALGEFFAWEYVPGERTLFRHIKKLLPGHALIVDLDAGSINDVTFWNLATQPEDHSHSWDDWFERVDTTIQQAVRRQLIADVPLGAFLSGGVDSSLVVAAMEDATTFSIGFDDPSYNELAYSREVAESLGVSHTTEVIQPFVADHFEHLMHFMDDPIGDFSIFPTFLVSQLARRDVTVALSGDGGDELFGGYETYLAQQKMSLYETLPAILRKRFVGPLSRALPPRPQKKGLINKIKRFVEGAELPTELGHARWRMFLDDPGREALFSGESLEQMHAPAGEHIARLYHEAAGLDDINQALYVDTKSYLVDNCLVKTDRMSMAVSLETRVPLLDKELVELAFRIPGGVKMRGGETKSLLKAIAASYVPRRSVYRPKEGFSIPIKQWLAGQFRPLLEDALNPARLARQGIFHPRQLERLKDEHISGRANHSHVLWSMIVFQNWWDTWYEVKT